MTKRIIYQNDTGGITLVTPFVDCGIPLEEIARKDVPAGKAYAILDIADIPSDFTFFDAWEVDPTLLTDGIGIGTQAWFIEQYRAEIATLDLEKDATRIKQLNDMIAIQQSEIPA